MEWHSPITFAAPSDATAIKCPLIQMCTSTENLKCHGQQFLPPLVYVVAETAHHPIEAKNVLILWLVAHSCAPSSLLCPLWDVDRKQADRQEGCDESVGSVDIVMRLERGRESQVRGIRFSLHTRIPDSLKNVERGIREVIARFLWKSCRPTRL